MADPTYRKQILRAPTSQQSSNSSSANLISKVLSQPELFPDEFKAWLPRFINQSVNLALSIGQLPQVESRKKVGTTGNAVFAGSWVNFGGTNESAQYYRDPWGRVYIGGIVKSGTIGTTIFTLPAGYRPEEAKIYPVVSNGVFGICTVNPDGTVVASAGNNTYFTLSGISFRAFT